MITVLPFSGLSGIAGGGTPAFNPSTYGTTELWLKADSLSLADEDVVSSWTDMSGSNRHATQATFSKRPTYAATGLNGKPTVRFDGVDDWLQTVDFGLSFPIEIFAVMTERSIFNNRRIMGGFTPFVTVLDRDSLSTYRVFSNSLSISFSDASTSPKLMHLRFTSSGAAISRNGGTESTGSSSLTSAPGGWTLGTSGDKNTFAGIDVSELIIMSTALTTGSRQGIRQALGAKWGITVS